MLLLPAKDVRNFIVCCLAVLLANVARSCRALFALQSSMSAVGTSLHSPRRAILIANGA
jgi:hypothetical protein